MEDERPKSLAGMRQKAAVTAKALEEVASLRNEFQDLSRAKDEHAAQHLVPEG